ncbi:LamG-like jellyroll fold domain-containing protein [Planctomycetota bacterium]
MTRSRRPTGMTLVELLIAMALMAATMTVLVPLFVGIRNSWTVAIGDTEVTQNARVLMDHVQRHLSQAKMITAISNDNDNSGYLEFRDADGTHYRYDLNNSDYVRFGSVDAPSPLAGPVKRLVFKGYALDDLSHPTQDTHRIRVVSVATTLAKGSVEGRDRDWDTLVFIHSDGVSQSGLNADLVGYWPFDEGAGGQAYDYSGWGHHGSLTNMSSSAWDNGVVGSSLTFSGDYQHVLCPLQIQGDFSIAFWLRTAQDALGSDQWWSGYGLVDTDVPGPQNDFGTGVVDGRFAFGVGTQGGGDSTLHSDTQINNGAWHHVVGTFHATSGLMQIYVDGIHERAGSGGSGIKDASPDIKIGNTGILADWNRHQAYVGRLDDVRLYERVLTGEEIEQLAAQLGEQSIYLALDEGTGVIAADTWNGYDATLHNMAADAWIAGRIDQALFFDGQDDYIEIPRTIGDDFSITFWIRTSDTGGGYDSAPWWEGRGLVDGDQPGGVDDFGVTLIDDHIAFGIGEYLGAGLTLHGSQVIVDGQWHHVASTRNVTSGRMRIFIDGSEDGSTQGDAGSKHQASTLRIGSRWSLESGGYYKGDLDDIRLYDRELSDAEIQSLFDSAP